MDRTDIVQVSQATESVEIELQNSGEKAYEGFSQQLLVTRGLSQLLLPLQVIDDVTLLRTQLKYFSKTTLKLSKRIYKQQEQIQKKTQQLQDCQHMYQQECVQKQLLATELAYLKASRSSTEKEVTLREKMLAEEPTQADSTRLDIMDRIQLLEGQNRKLLAKLRESQKSLTKERESLTLKDYDIDQQKIQMRELRDTLDNQRAKSRDKELEIISLKNRLNEVSEEYSDIKGQIGLLKLENRELERQLSQFKHSFKKIEQIELIKLTSKGPEQKSQQMLEASQSISYNQLSQKYRILKNNYQTLKNQANYLKYRIQSMTSDERDAEHIVIDRFIQVLNIYRDKLKQGEAPIKANLDRKKEAFMRRLAKEYQNFIQTVPLN